jgi:exonuclease SbcC
MLIKMKDQELYNLTLNLWDFEIQKNKLNEELWILTEMYQLYSRDGIPTELIKEISEEIENEWNKYLSQFSGGKYAMKFIFEEERKSGKWVKREFDIKILDNDIIRNYSQLSWGEQTRIDWAQHIAFSKVLYKKFNKPFIDLLVIDEGFGTQWEKALNKVINALSILEKEFSNILIISHHPLLQWVFTNHLTVLKDENTGRTIIN